jgi:hydroxymethylbilane synthase
MSGLRIGTRGSALALAQTQLVADLLGGGEIVAVRTSGDRGAGNADKSRWVDAIEDALLAGEIDLAVHSAKDVPGELADGLALLGAPARAAAEDVLCIAPHSSQGRVGSSAGNIEHGNGAGGMGGARENPGGMGGADGEDGGPAGLDALPEGARVGTSSIRRAAQLRAARADLDVVAIAGNVDTRVRGLATGEHDAIVVARAGLQRLGFESQIGAVLDPARFVPAPGQGALALEARAGEDRVAEAVEAILDADATACLLAERAVASALHASCHTPLGAHACTAGCGCLGLRAWVGLPDGSAFLADELLGGFYDPAGLGARMAERMSAAGADELLRRAEEMVGDRV